MLTVVFYARFLIHHLTNFCDRMYELTNGNFYFVETEKMPPDRKSMGYKEEGLSRPYCINIRESHRKELYALMLATECDVAIIGCGSYRFMNQRLEHTNKLTFKLKERLYKKGVATRYDPIVKADMYQKHQKFMGENVYYLSAGTFTATDVNFLRCEQERILKWGYFPPFRQHTHEDFVQAKRKDILDMIWVGRFMPTKHPQIPIKALRYVIKSHPNVHLSYIGGGELEPEMRMLVEKFGLQEHVTFEGYISSDKVRDRMLKADILLCTSGYEEGWGATISEGMNEGCMIIASMAAGGTGYLVHPGENGSIFFYRNIRALADCICRAAENALDVLQFGENGYQKIANVWNGQEAAERLYEVSARMLRGEEWNLYESGPCSIAPIIHTMKELGQWGHAHSPRKKIKIAIDGLSGCGKSTIAKALARDFGLLYIDSGALYRLAAYFLKRKDTLTREDMDFLHQVNITNEGHILYDGICFDAEIALLEVKQSVSYVAQNAIVRDCVNEWIRCKAASDSVVIDGRDIGSIVLPDADVKVYITCSLDHRIHNWRKGQMEKHGTIDAMAEAEERTNLEMRDYNDIHREIAPLTCVEGAYKFDLEVHGMEKILHTIADVVKRRMLQS